MVNLHTNFCRMKKNSFFFLLRNRAICSKLFAINEVWNYFDGKTLWSRENNFKWPLDMLVMIRNLENHWNIHIQIQTTKINRKSSFVEVEICIENACDHSMMSVFVEIFFLSQILVYVPQTRKNVVFELSKTVRAFNMNQILTCVCLFHFNFFPLFTCWFWDFVKYLLHLYSEFHEKISLNRL